MQTLALTKAPIIASHSSVRKLANHSRNLDDEQLLALKKNGGVMQTVAFNGYVKIRRPTRRSARRRSTRCARNSACRRARLSAAAAAWRRARRRTADAARRRRSRVRRRTGRGAQRRRCARRPAAAAAAGGGQGRGGGRGNALAALTEEQRAALQTKLAEHQREVPGAGARATVKDFVDHIDYAVKLIGIDHVGISSDFDGGGGVDGWNGADETFNVTLELVRRGYTEEADREALERQPAARAGRGPGGREEAAEVADRGRGRGSGDWVSGVGDNSSAGPEPARLRPTSIPGPDPPIAPAELAQRVPRIWPTMQSYA